MFYSKNIKMNFLKKTMILLSAILAFYACSDDESTTDNSASTISLSTSAIQMDKNGGQATVTVTSSGDWKLSGVCEWAHPSATSGKDGDVVTFTIDPNKENEKRTATFKFFTGASVAPLVVEIDLAYVMKLESEDNISVHAEGGTVNISLVTNILDPTITYSEEGGEWLKFDRRTDFGGKTTMIFTVDKNTAYKERSSTITLSSTLISESININVTQKELEAVIADLENDSFTYDLKANTLSFNLRYNIDYTTKITGGSEWITETRSTPQAGDDGLSTVTLTYKLAESPTTRKGMIRITTVYGELVKEIAITQLDPNAKLIEIPDETMRSVCLKNDFIIHISGSQCIVLEAGLNATSFNNDSYNSFKSIEGIENFPNLVEINLGYSNYLEKLDISGLHKVKSLTFSNPTKCREYNLGDNPILNFYPGGERGYTELESLKFISSKLENLNLSLHEWYQWDDWVTSIDVSECPALTTLNADRSDKVKTLYLKTGQVIPNLIKNKVTEISYK